MNLFFEIPKFILWLIIVMPLEDGYSEVVGFLLNISGLCPDILIVPIIRMLESILITRLRTLELIF